MLQGVDDDNRFGFLLKPIRDLTKNWDVDIAGHLEEYLEELDNVAITFDGGRTMNFAEAALLIQGSTCVYSRKVEYLYVLVYEVLDLLVSKKRNKQDNAGKRSEDGDPDVTFDDDDNQLLPLDDIQELEIFLKEDGKSVATIPRRPMSMIPFGEEMGDDPLLSKTGEILGRRKDFRLNTSLVHRDGSLLLEASAQMLCGLYNKSPEIQRTALTDDGAPIEIEVNDDLLEAGCQNFDDDDGADNHFEDGCKDSSVLPVEEEEKKVDEGVKRSEQIREMMLDKAKFSSAPTKIDPWHEQDPFEPKKMTDKAFKKCKTFRIPSCLNEKKSKKRKRIPEEKRMEEMVLVGEFIASTLFSYKQKLPKVLQESCLPESEKSCWLKLSERQTKKKMEINAMETILEQQILESENNQEENVDIVAGGVVCADGDDNDEDEDVGPVLNWQDDLFHDVVEPIVNDDSENDEPASSYEQLVQKHIEAFYVGAQKYAQITELSKKIAEWEARIIPKLKEEETSEPFDIRVYGTKILNCTPNGSKIPIAKLMAGKAPREIGRLFLSTLMLANAGNLEISCPGVLEEGIDKAEVELIRTKLHFEELETYVAPSLANKDKEN